MSEQTATDTQVTKKKLTEEISLDFPVVHQGVTHDELTMRRPTIRDILKIERMESEDKRHKQERCDLEKAIETYASLCDVSPQVIEQMATCDFKRLDKAYEDFLS